MTTNTGIDLGAIGNELAVTERETAALQIRLQQHQNKMTNLKAVFDAQKECHETSRRMLDDATRA